ncbi:mammalian cell entry protein [Mycobacterium asiaticum]|uniref:Mammalian cell entry protein n=1 Tax=Mycobacterium asiaticum TaxID=1790 RepID=A0A1A3CI02_MYCAS|nr:mammalian cell entry protein [Mycobacterium asiaticum]
MSTETETETETETDVEAESEVESDLAADIPAPGTAAKQPRRAIAFGLAAVTALATLLCWFGFRVDQNQQELSQRTQFLQVARQAALNLTTIDWRHADADVRRILDGATGEFHNDFAKRSQPFIEVLREAKASTVGTITEAALESQTADTAQALVVVSVQTSNAGTPEPVPRVWRMRITVQRSGAGVKVANVGFVA